MELRPDILRTYVASAQSLNFTKAAKLVNLTQSAVSLQIRKLEGELGKSLFKRISRGVELTHDGKALLSYAIRLLQLHDEAIASVNGRNNP
jgi:DNA-binding transcriptional LysR family regulator